MYKKRRYRKRYRRNRRMRAMRRKMRRSKANEVKVYTNTLFGMPIYLYTPNAGNRTASDRDGIIQNVLNGIGLGTNYAQRLGNKIFVKFIRVTHVAYQDYFTISEGGQNVDYSPNTVGIRIMWTNDQTTPATPTSAGAANSDFYSINSTCKFISPINRRKYRVFYDKRRIINSGWTTNKNDVSGGLATWSYRINVNRSVVYNDFESTGGGTKEDWSFYNLKAIAHLQGYNNSQFRSTTGSPVPGLSPLVLDTVVRVYYTDS